MALSAPSMAILTSSGAWKGFFIPGASLSVLEWAQQREKSSLLWSWIFEG